MMTKTLAILNGKETHARRINGYWLIGGDHPQKDDSVLIAAHHAETNRLAWHKLQGCRLKFQDFLDAKDLVKIADMEG